MRQEEVESLASTIADRVKEEITRGVGIRDVVIGSAMGEGAIPLYGRETRKEPCSCCLIEPEGPNTPENRMCTTKGAIGTLNDREEREWCSEIKIVADGRCARARSIREAAKVCKEKHPADTTKFFECYIPAFSQITKGSNPGKEPWQTTEAVGNLGKGAWVQFKPDGIMYQITDVGRARVTLVDGEGNISTIPLRQAVYPLESKPRTADNPGEYVTITDPGKTTFKVGEVISREAFDKENERVKRLGEKPSSGR
ncbi:hypothetical protein ES708_30768 [subsurface metagenome]